MTDQRIRSVVLAIGRVVIAAGIVAVLIVMNPFLDLIVSVVVGGSYGASYAFVP